MDVMMMSAHICNSKLMLMLLTRAQVPQTEFDDEHKPLVSSSPLHEQKHPTLQRLIFEIVIGSRHFLSLHGQCC